jgi:hypothetical protein
MSNLFIKSTLILVLLFTLIGCDDDDDSNNTSECCVELQFDATSIKYCGGPVNGGTPTDTPNIVLSPNGIFLNASLDKNDDSVNTLLAVVYGATDLGTFVDPYLDIENNSGSWYENNAMSGNMTIDNWTAPGTMITGTFDGTVYKMNGTGPDSYYMSGTFCAVRQADKN